MSDDKYSIGRNVIRAVMIIGFIALFVAINDKINYLDLTFRTLILGAYVSL